MSKIYDVAIVGAGPTGLAAAVYTTREDLQTVIVDGGVVGGLIATTEIVDNYPGFPDGIGGLELADLMRKQAERFGAEIRTGVKVTALKKADDYFEIASNADPIMAKSVLIATGSSYRHIGAPGEEVMIGRGIHYCATCDGPLYRDKHILVVGGGNSALQESLFLTKFVKKITMLVRGPEFKGAEILAEQIKADPKIDIHFNTAVAEVLDKDGKFKGVKTNTGQNFDADGLFAFVGLIPNSQWLKGDLDLDERGFIKVDKAMATTLGGVFAAGDVVSGSVGQIASAVGEGVSASISIRHYLSPHHALK